MEGWARARAGSLGGPGGATSDEFLALQRHRRFVQALHHKRQVLGQFVDWTSDRYHVWKKVDERIRNILAAKPVHKEQFINFAVCKNCSEQSKFCGIS